MNAEVRQLMESASRGHAPSQRELAERFFRGQGVERSVAQAYGWLSLAARNGDDSASYLMCELCRRGILGVAIGPRPQ
jgi:TPR repeat protein